MLRNYLLRIKNAENVHAYKNEYLKDPYDKNNISISNHHIITDIDVHNKQIFNNLVYQELLNQLQ